jgi:hypothetical protein
MFLAPTLQLSDAEREEGLKHLVREAGFSNAVTAVTSGVILTAFALHLGASNTTIGLLAAAAFWVQLLQAPGVLLVERFRARKRIAVLASLISRCALVGLAALALAPRAGGFTLAALVALQVFYCGIATFGGCAWNAWVRDLAPEARLGQIFAKRTINATLVGLVASLAAAFALDRAPEGSTWRPIAFAGLYAGGLHRRSAQLPRTGLHARAADARASRAGEAAAAAARAAARPELPSPDRLPGQLAVRREPGHAVLHGVLRQATGPEHHLRGHSRASSARPPTSWPCAPGDCCRTASPTSPFWPSPRRCSFCASPAWSGLRRSTIPPGSWPI